MDANCTGVLTGAWDVLAIGTGATTSIGTDAQHDHVYWILKRNVSAADSTATNHCGGNGAIGLNRAIMQPLRPGQMVQVGTDYNRSC